MKRRRVLFIQSSQFKLFLRRVTITLVVLFAFFLVLLSKADNTRLSATENMASRVFNPVIRVLQLPVDGVDFAFQKIKNFFFVYSENERLRKSLEDLSVLKNRLQILEVEHALLSEALHYAPLMPAEFLTAKVISAQGDSFNHSLIVYLKNKERVKEGQIALYKENVIGRVENLSGDYARIMLITDINSKIPVFLKKDKTRAILAGNNTSTLDLLYAPSNAKLAVGDEVLTSGIGGIFPTGLPIGSISEIKASGVKVKPFASMEEIEYVRIVDYGLTDDMSKESDEQ